MTALVNPSRDAPRTILLQNVVDDHDQVPLLINLWRSQSIENIFKQLAKIVN